MSGKAKLLFALALVAVIYVLVSGGSEPVEVEVEE
ncbi:hypothetical protein C499_07865 [Halogeometricum borinquense DSM 11551]|uniref:Uncharacterized protein n=1 Tax=Halogeometricum borinquense (strain ATCC 700274 / DSM 11551 / JCM 10706 / KCTC 4070 / PR3) TaxID=469382 RepID=E4NMT7_HALBP|nr:hypothetical protein Hbor_17810 [Halogeometricum borinquense DSM 11551]ELY28562.1 hypothetical protein C499_07865 [Halogeometricum borinquense DSM 11551]